METHCLVLLIKVVNISVQDLDEEFHRHCCVHAGICNAECSLETFENALSVAVELVGDG